MPILTELETIEKAKEGNQQAFRVLVESYQGFVYSIAFRFTDHEAEAEDLVQECFIRLWKNLNRYNSEHKLKSWLCKIITNLCLDHLKSARRKNEKNRINMDDRLPATDPIHHETELDASELHTLVLKLAERLTPKQRAAFILRDLEMLDVEEVCEILGISAGNLKSNLYYARLSIKGSVMKYYKLQQHEVPRM